ncbi:Adenylyl-sulfate kinase (plasmid) [Gemmatirosa kalamazoonensis]|uniref:Adenylyl-sulfate kinase n=1 Tax=Gemmatirosa kalamazoonensis TaxID=861299 RepID=W0RSY0_9BACT|nr:adenylyl-sulfate kinase [Gemmatirosa kalamazoonensis]AHG93582.1 Adenylyl-sulfate kinase [Gemmatirosa kalamazoonensis]
MFYETHWRSIIKAVSWRIMGTVATALLVFIFTRKLALSLWVGALEFTSKIGLYWLHERVWDRLRFGKKEVRPAVIWFTGLSGAGKSTIADKVYRALQERGLRVERLDGDSVRDIFPATGFTRPERDQHVRRIGFLASKLEQNGVTVVASFVSPYEESRQFVRGLCGRFVEVHVATPLAECEKRDVKGLYAKARRGEITNFTGIDDPYEEPTRPELRLDTAALSLDESTLRVLQYLDKQVLRVS